MAGLWLKLVGIFWDSLKFAKWLGSAMRSTVPTLLAMQGGARWIALWMLRGSAAFCFGAQVFGDYFGN